MWIFCWIILLFVYRPIYSGYIELVTVSGCENCKLYLTCRHLTSIIAIYHAEFIQHEVNFNRTLSNNNLTNENYMFSTNRELSIFPQIHPRQALNKRCSGVNHCSFILTEDCPGAELWGAGTLNVTYACISDDRIRKFCNSEILLPDTKDSGISEGFIHNPGYPRFYASEKHCRWTIKAPAQQKIHITILDLALYSPGFDSDSDCTDYLEIIDERTQVTNQICQPHDPPIEIQSNGDTLDMFLVSKHSLTPLRGLLIHYKAVGCPTPPAPEDGYLVYRNDTVAEFRCCVGFAFEGGDDDRTRIINCLGSYWDVALPLPNCQRTNALQSVSTVLLRREKEMASELVAPAIVIVALFLINSIVLLYIYKMKKRNAIVIEDEELGTLKSNDDKVNAP